MWVGLRGEESCPRFLELGGEQTARSGSRLAVWPLAAGASSAKMVEVGSVSGKPGTCVDRDVPEGVGELVGQRRMGFGEFPGLFCVLNLKV